MQIIKVQQNSQIKVRPLDTPGGIKVDVLVAPLQVKVDGVPGPRGASGPPVTQTKGMTIGLPEASENLLIVYTVEEITLQRLSAVLQGGVGASLTYTIKFGPDRAGPGTEVRTGGITVSGSAVSNVDAFDAAVIPADSFVWFETSAKVGVVEQFHVTMTY